MSLSPDFKHTIVEENGLEHTRMLKPIRGNDHESLRTYVAVCSPHTYWPTEGIYDKYFVINLLFIGQRDN